MFATWSGQGLQPTTTLAGHAWVHAANPGPEELERLVKELAVPAELLAHALDADEVSRIDHAGGASFILVRMPSVSAGDFATTPLALVLLPGRVVSITPSPADDLLSRLALPADLEPARPTRLVLRVLERVAARYLVDLKDLDGRVDEVEERLQRSLRNAEVLELLAYQKGLVHFETALASNRIMLERMQREERLLQGPEDHELLEDVLVEFHQASARTEVSANILSSTMDAFASIISNNLNAVMKVVTSLTLLFAIPTAVASFFGMNVPLPLAQHQLAFEATVGLSLLLVGLAVFLFRRLRWL